MDRPSKRQKLSQEPVYPIPTRTLDLDNFQRTQNQRRSPGKVLHPRAPDVTVTSGVLEVAVNDGSTTTQIAAPTADIAVTLDSLGTLIVPGVSTSTGSGSSASGSGSQSSSQTSSSDTSSLGDSSSSNEQLATTVPSNSTAASSTERTVTVIETSTFHVSYSNGTFVAQSSTQSASQTGSSTDDESTSDSSTDSGSASSSGYVFGQGVTDSYTSYTTGTGTDYGNAAVGATATGAGSAATSSGGANGNGNANGTDTPSAPVLTPQQTQMVGGIVGGVAGIALVLIVILYVLRWYRQRLKQQGRLPEQLKPGHNRGGSGLISSAAPMSETRSPFPSAVMASGMKKWRPTSVITTMTNTTSTTRADSEKGFHRVSGRKIPSVLSTGGDQFGGSYGAFEKETGPPPLQTNYHHRHDLSDSSFYRDADGTYVGSSHDADNGRPVSRSLPTTPIYPAIFSGDDEPSFASPNRRPSLANLSSQRDFAPGAFNTAFYRNLTIKGGGPDGVAMFRSSPARTPITQSPNVSSIGLPIQAPVTMDGDVPEMPLGSPGMGVYIPGGQQRVGTASQLSERGSGRFREEIA